MSLETILKLSGIFLGILARSLLPWLRKLREGKVGRFSRRYLYSALASLIFGTIVTLAIFPQLEYVASGQDFEHYFKLFCLAFGFGFGWNALVLEGTQWAGSLAAPKPPKETNPEGPN
jgi:hypothetical protein